MNWAPILMLVSLTALAVASPVAASMEAGEGDGCLTRQVVDAGLCTSCIILEGWQGGQKFKCHPDYAT